MKNEPAPLDWATMLRLTLERTGAFMMGLVIVHLIAHRGDGWGIFGLVMFVIFLAHLMGVMTCARAIRDGRVYSVRK